MARVSLKRANLEWHLVTTGRRPLAFIRVQILVKTTVNDKRQKARIPATKLQWLPARHAILTSGSGRTLDGRESLRAGRDAQLLPCRPAVRYPGPNAHTGPDGRTSVNQPLGRYTGRLVLSAGRTASVTVSTGRLVLSAGRTASVAVSISRHGLLAASCHRVMGLGWANDLGTGTQEKCH